MYENTYLLSKVEKESKYLWINEKNISYVLCIGYMYIEVVINIEDIELIIKNNRFIFG